MNTEHTKSEYEVIKSAQKLIKEILSRTTESEWETTGWQEFFSKKIELHLDNYDVFSLDRFWKSTIKDYKEEEEKKTTKTDRLLKKILEEKNAQLFIDERDVPYISITIDDHRETHRIGSSVIRGLISYEGYKETGKAVSSEVVKNIVSTLEGMARFEGDVRTLANRVAFYDDAIWYDLTNQKWQVVKITKDGWEIINNPPAIFRRYSHHAPQVTPVTDGDVSLLEKYLNVNDEHGRKLLGINLVCFLIPGFPHPAVLLSGPQGSSKSTQSKIYSKLIDPSMLEVVTMPKKVDELIQQLDHHYFIPFDNVSFLSEEISDTLCRAITGAGSTKRTFYTNDDDTIYNFKRCVVINGINDVATRPDLLERSIIVELYRINEKDRRQEKDIWNEFNDDLPKILGGIFDVLVKTLNIYPSIRIESLPRMADFAVWGCAVAEAIGYSKESFLSTYKKNINNQATVALNNNPVALAVLSLMESQIAWSGTATQLLATLNQRGSFEDQRGAGIPQNTNVLTRKLNELKVSLESLGILYESKHTGDIREIHLTKIPKMPNFESVVNDTNDIF